MSSLESFWPLEVGNILIAPILHGCLEFSKPVRDLVKEVSPQALAIELPAGMEALWLKGVARFPRLSLIAPDRLDKADRAVSLWRLEPSDPFCEAIRTAVELELPVFFVDDLELGYPPLTDRLPDPYSITALGLPTYVAACMELFDIQPVQGKGERESIDLRRELHMAARLEDLAKDKKVLFLCGLKHARPMARLLSNGESKEAPAAEPLDLKLYHPSLRTLRTIAGEMPFLMALYELRRGGPGGADAWTDSARGDSRPGFAVKDNLDFQQELPELDRKSVFSSLEKLLGMKAGSVSEKDLSPGQLKQMLTYLRSLKPQGFTPPNLSDVGARKEDPPAQSLDDLEHASGQLGFFTFRDVSSRRAELLNEYERINLEVLSASGAIDRQAAYWALTRLAASFYADNVGDRVKDWQLLNLSRFARRYAALQGKLLPGTLSMLYSARACVDHNFAYELWDLATFYPWQDDKPGEASLFDFDGDNLKIDGMEVRHFQFQRTFPRLRSSITKLPLAKRAQPVADPSDWAQAFEDGHICSYPPEDVIIEDYGRYLQKKAVKVQSEAHSRSEPFTTSLLDGIDVRTTMRNWAEGRRIYVKQERKISGGTGAVVVVFASDAEEYKYPWGITWHGEHEQEADMAFFATDRKSKIIGPGIARCEYGGLMLSYPSRRLGSVWGDPAYRAAKTKAETLLMAAIDYCLDKHVIYVGPKAPRSYFFAFAQKFGKKLVYLPIGTLSPTSIERIRIFHVLAGHQYREIAKNFIW